MAWLCNSLNKYISLRPSIPFMGTRSTWGHFRQQISCDCVQICSRSSYTVAVCDCVFHLYDFLHSRSLRLCISSVRFLSSSSSSSVNTSKSYISDMTWPILTRLGHKYRLTIPFMWHNQIRVKGHVGVTGVKRSFSLKTLLLLQITGYGHVTHVHTSAWPLYKSYGSKNSPGVIWGHRGQKVIFTKNATSPTVYRVWSCDSCTCISLTPLYKSYGSKNSPWGHLGSQGSKGYFH